MKIALSSVLLWAGLLLPAHAITLSFDPAIGSTFTYSAQAGLGTVGGSLNTLTATCPNTVGQNCGFGGFFTSDYGRLGSGDGGSANGNQQTGSRTATSATNFTIATTELFTISFDYFFNGNPSAGLVDVFSVAISGPSSFSQNLTVFGSSSSFTSSSFLLTPGSYSLVFTLVEQADTFSSAAGFSTATLTGTAIPEPTTTLGLLALAGLGLGAKRKRA